MLRGIASGCCERRRNGPYGSDVAGGRTEVCRQTSRRSVDVDGEGFDRLARIWGTGTDRRRALHLLGVGLLAGGWLGSRDDAGAQETGGPVTCIQDDDCFDGDLDLCTGASCVDGLCTYFVVDCIPGHVCCGNGACCPIGEPGSCLADSDCALASSDPCQGVRCEGGACVPYLFSCAPGFACCGNGTCCEVAGGCVVDTDCTPFTGGVSARTRCVSGVCVPTSALTR